MKLVKSEPASDLDNFITFLFGGLEGYAYMVACDRTKEKSDPTYWNTEFFEYPAQHDYMVNLIPKAARQYEVYLAPVLYNSSENAQRENVKVSNVVWTEFDGNAPDWKINAGGIGEPSYRIQSGLPGHEHVYWKLTEPLMGSDAIEAITERITHNFGADSSAWDATQVLRPPDTINYKRSGLMVTVVDHSEVLYDRTVFDSLAPAPPRAEINWQVGELPDLQGVLLTYAIGKDIQKLLRMDREEVKDRSASLMNAAFACCQLGMSDNEVFVIIRHLDTKWQKFTDRLDRERRLAQIVTIARNKYPEPDKPAEHLILEFDYKTFMQTEIEIDWVVSNMMMEQGSLLMTGPSGVGKTQLSLQFAKHIALGKDYLHYKIPQPKKIALLSLEMGHPDLQIFLRTQESDLTADEIDLLGENLTIYPLGESWSLNTQMGQELLIEKIEQHEWDGIMVDSVGSAILGNINSQEVVQAYVNFVDRVRHRYGMFWWAIHHNRKKQPGQSHTTQDDVYGDQYLVNRARSVYTVLPTNKGILRVANFKQTMARKEETYGLIRTDSLNFELVGNDEVPEELTMAKGNTKVSDMSPGGLKL